jgi:hypothetical protein
VISREEEKVVARFDKRKKKPGDQIKKGKKWELGIGILASDRQPMYQAND